MEFTVVDKKKWDSLPAPVPPKPKDRYEPLLHMLEQGNIIRIPVEAENEMKGIRIAIGRKSRARGWVAEFRSEYNILYVKRSDKEIEPAKPKKKKEKVAEEA